MLSASFSPDWPLSLKAKLDAALRGHPRLSPVGLPSGRPARPGLPRILLDNQNLLYLVFKCLMNTKHSGQSGGRQGVFDAQNGCIKTTTKTGSCGAVAGISTNVPPLFHRLVHREAADERLPPRCGFATAPKAERRNMTGG
jgi:hypothetical protein